MSTTTHPFGTELVAGDRWKWTVTLADYPADVWKLTYYFRGTSTLDVASTASGTDHALDALPTATSGLQPGQYAWQAIVEKRADATERYEIGRGTIQLLRDTKTVSAGSGIDLRSDSQKVLDAIRATILGTASREEKQYQVMGRSLEVRSPRELLELEGIFAARVKNEQIAAGVAPANQNMVHVRFGRPS